MSNIRTRYLQLSDVVMMEYTFLGENDVCTVPSPEEFIFTKLLDGHYTTFSPCSYETTTLNASTAYRRKQIDSVRTFNTLNHLAVPKDAQKSYWYTFLDPDYEYNTIDNQTSLNIFDPKSKEYSKYCVDASNARLLNNPFDFIDIEQNMRWDSLKLYFVNGYDFSNIYGILTRVSLLRTDGEMVDLCDTFFNKANAHNMLKYLSNPIIFGNCVYDRYIEINTLCLYDILNTTAVNKVNDYLKISNTSNIRLTFSYVYDDNYKVEDISYEISQLINNPTNDNVNCSFLQGSTINGTIPFETITSDNLGLYIGENADSPYIEFYGTWKNAPLSFGIVQSFNRNIKLYDTSLIKKENGVYDVPTDYSADINLKKWVAMHELECRFLRNNEILKTETYNMSQVFVDNIDDEIVKFYYRPVIFDEALSNIVTAVSINYTMRFINVEDKVQFMKKGSLSITNVNKFYAKGSKIKVNDVIPYKVYNKIIESNQSIVGNVNVSPKTKYIKVFYNSTDVLLEERDGTYYTSNSYVLKLSPVAKTYKFVIKKYITSSKYDYFDLSDGYYKLYTKDANNNPIVIDPTYSTNMNTVLGEIEFNISTSIINRLQSVPENNRKMSIVAYNADNSVSSLYDFTYTF